ncbi:LysR family transcriptional regulator [Novosphingobium piscinae]|uniref:LysR family transcriptional regulator n=1 Tax=Novosphingobium piscinae TaxID=1507448 RepID=A0A7X1KQL2_9SPHN|nr:LysR family transcriptional regulator [Novosphingobium piscinae]MBC2669675.1 LysR family transcriptional regulator [Novosphingobium piscinae]
MDWDDVRSFLAIARARSLSGAARELGVRQSTMSRRLEALEARAGARLLQRTPRGYEMTALGEAVLGNAERMEAEAIAVERAVQGRDVALSGVVRLTTVEVIAERLVPPAIAALHARYPGITIDVLSDPRSFNLSRREADIAIRMTRFEGADLVSRRMTVAALAIYASEDYLARHGDPLAPDSESGEHSLVTVLEDQAHLTEVRWFEEQLPRARKAVRTNNRNGQLAAVRAGLGLGCLPCALADGEPGLVRLTSPGAAPLREIWLGVHEDLRHMPRIRAVIDALETAFAATRAAWQGQ